MATEGADTDRTTVQTYIPTYQKDRWQDDATHLEMSLSEFVRTMVQAGRRGFVEPEREETQTTESTSPTPPPGDGLAAFVETALSEAEYRSWDALVDDLEDVLQQLQDQNRVAYSGREGGYTLTDE